MRCLLPILLLVFTACTPFTTSTPPPPPQILHVAFTPTLENWQEKLHQCALDQPEIALITFVTTAIDKTIWDSNIILWFGEPPAGESDFAVVLGKDEIIIIGGKSVGLQNLTLQQLRTLYTDPESIYQTWTYPEGNELRTIFDQVVFEGVFASPNSFLAPNPTAMLEAISREPLAIGYLPKSWLAGNEKIISIDDLSSALQQPIVGVTASQPQAEISTYLNCLQNTEP